MSPRGLASALAWKGGVNNSAVQLVRVDADRLQQLRDRVAAASKVMKDYFTRCNDVEFEQDHGNEESQTMEQVAQADVSITMHVSLYSGVDRTRMRVTLGNATTKASVHIGADTAESQIDSTPDADESQIDSTQDPDADESQIDSTQDPDAEESQIDSTQDPDADESQIDPTQDPDADESQIDPTQDPDADESQSDPTQDPGESQTDPTQDPDARDTNNIRTHVDEHCSQQPHAFRRGSTEMQRGDIDSDIDSEGGTMSDPMRFDCIIHEQRSMFSSAASMRCGPMTDSSSDQSMSPASRSSSQCEPPAPESMSQSECSDIEDSQSSSIGPAAQPRSLDDWNDAMETRAASADQSSCTGHDNGSQSTASSCAATGGHTCTDHDFDSAAGTQITTHRTACAEPTGHSAILTANNTDSGATLPSDESQSIASSCGATGGRTCTDDNDDSRLAMQVANDETACADNPVDTAEQSCAGTAEQPQIQQDFSGEIVTEALVVDGNGGNDEDVDVLNDSEGDDGSDDVWVAPRLSYAPTGIDGSMHLTLVHVVNSSSIDFRSLVAPKPKKRNTRQTGPNNNEPLRKDTIAVAVRFASGLIQSNVVSIRHGTADAPARQQTLKPRQVGWARRPAHGDTLGASYLHRYEHEVVEMFNAGVMKSTAKRGPAQMREELKLRHPGVFAIPSLAALTRKVSTLFKASRDNGGTVVGLPAENGSTTTRRPRRGRPSVLPNDLIEFLLAAIARDPTVKPAQLLKLVRDRFQDLDEVVTDQKIKSKVSSIKAANKKANLKL